MMCNVHMFQLLAHQALPGTHRIVQNLLRGPHEVLRNGRWHCYLEAGSTKTDRQTDRQTDR
jgi:hypothetical protein